MDGYKDYVFDRSQIREVMAYFMEEGNEKYWLQRYLDSGKIIRIGRNRYRVNSGAKANYAYDYSAFSKDIASIVKEIVPSTEFRLLEFAQYSEFINLATEEDIAIVFVRKAYLMDVYGRLSRSYPGRILYLPEDPFECNARVVPGTVIVEPLISEAPSGHPAKWHTPLEKMAVDMVAEMLLKGIFRRRIAAGIFKSMCQKYAVNDSAMRRYARRRGVEQKMLSFQD